MLFCCQFLGRSSALNVKVKEFDHALDRKASCASPRVCIGIQFVFVLIADHHNTLRSVQLLKIQFNSKNRGSSIPPGLSPEFI